MTAVRRLLGAAALALLGSAAGAAETLPLASLQAQADLQVQAGFDHPDAALAALDRLAAQAGPGPAAERVLLQARGLVAAQAGRAPSAEAVAAALDDLGRRMADPLAVGDAALVRAALANSQGRVAESLQAAQTALGRYKAECAAGATARNGCDWRTQWQALQMLSRLGTNTGQMHQAREQALAAAELARNAGDVVRQTVALASAADLSAALGDGAAEQRDITRAQRLARLDGTPLLMARLAIFESRLMQAHGDTAGAQRAAEQGLQLARQADSPRTEAVHLANLSDIHVKSGRPQAALQAVEQALPLVRKSADRRIERVLLHNAALARIALGQGDSARRTLDELLRVHAAEGANGDQVVVLREFADAFAAAGDHVTALALYHRERKLAAEIMAANRSAALAELRERFDREAQQRRLEQLSRENDLITQKLENRQAMQRILAAGAVALLLAMGLVALLYRRVRQINRHLSHNHAFLRAQSQRDPLTGLANRRALHDCIKGLDRVERFSGALLLVDIDHFKHVNDGHGHAAGDLVLVAVAERLAAAAGEQDLVVRWGGEEFLIFMPGAGGAQAQALAARVLQAVGSTPVALPRGPLRVTASVGYGAFPLPPARLALGLERAINLADMALYTAKNQGRNRAIGIASAQAEDSAALLALEADFDLAWREGRLSLLRLAGPTAEPASTAEPPAVAVDV